MNREILERHELKAINNYEYDVAVCGGGIAGISAALASVRQDKKNGSF